jgi:hypothetical protein
MKEIKRRGLLAGLPSSSDYVVDDQMLYSMSPPREAKKVARLLKSLVKDVEEPSILDGTCGAGGDTIAFIPYFDSVLACDIDPERTEATQFNVGIVFERFPEKIERLTVETANVKTLFDPTSVYDVVYLDAPWGGPGYDPRAPLSLTGVLLSELVGQALHVGNSLIAVKVPRKYVDPVLCKTAEEAGKMVYRFKLMKYDVWVITSMIEVPDFDFQIKKDKVWMYNPDAEKESESWIRVPRKLAIEAREA